MFGAHRRADPCRNRANPPEASIGGRAIRALGCGIGGRSGSREFEGVNGSPNSFDMLLKKMALSPRASQPPERKRARRPSVRIGYIASLLLLALGVGANPLALFGPPSAWLGLAFGVDGISWGALRFVELPAKGRKTLLRPPGLGTIMESAPPLPPSLPPSLVRRVRSSYAYYTQTYTHLFAPCRLTRSLAGCSSCSLALSLSLSVCFVQDKRRTARTTCAAHAQNARTV